jgi:hypothetical protein
MACKIYIPGGTAAHYKTLINAFPHFFRQYTSIMILDCGNGILDREGFPIMQMSHIILSHENLVQLIRALIPNATIYTTDLIPRTAKGNSFYLRSLELKNMINKISPKHHHLVFFHLFLTVNRGILKLWTKLYRKDNTHLNRYGRELISGIIKHIVDGTARTADPPEFLIFPSQCKIIEDE